MVARSRPYRAAHDGLKQDTVGPGFDMPGDLPSGALDPVAEAAMPGFRVWTPSDGTGGRLDWNEALVNPNRSNARNSITWELRTVLLFSSVAFSYSAFISDGTTDVLWKSGGPISNWVCNDKLTLPPGFFLKIVTTGATAPVSVIAFASSDHDSTRR